MPLYECRGTLSPRCWTARAVCLDPRKIERKRTSFRAVTLKALRCKTLQGSHWTEELQFVRLPSCCLCFVRGKGRNWIDVSITWENGQKGDADLKGKYIETVRMYIQVHQPRWSSEFISLNSLDIIERQHNCGSIICSAQVLQNIRAYAESQAFQV